MNAKTTLLGIGIALSVLTPALRADTSAHAAIVKKREAVLSKIVADVESRHASGTADDNAVWTARLALYSFRRDAAQTTNEKLRHQEQIVALREEALGALKARAKAGTADPLDLLRATDAVLAAKQLLEALKADAQKGPG
jgi:hypothetical protein